MESQSNEKRNSPEVTGGGGCTQEPGGGVWKGGLTQGGSAAGYSGGVAGAGQAARPLDLLSELTAEILVLERVVRDCCGPFRA